MNDPHLTALLEHGRKQRRSDAVFMASMTAVGLVFLIFALAVFGCAAPGTIGNPSPSTSLLRQDTPTTVGYVDVPGMLAQLDVNDRPHTDADYRRDAWPHWKDLDGDGRDPRDDLIEKGRVGASGRDVWRSDYDNEIFTDPRRMDVDHIVPLAEAHRSGGWTWETYQRAEFANDPANLRLVSATSNRSKGDKTPDLWRPPAEGAWCEYARSYAYVKAHYRLTVTTAERDALGQMLETC